MTIRFKDSRDEPLSVGDYVAKAQRQSSSVWLNVYKILALLEEDKTEVWPAAKIRGEIVATTGWRADIGKTSTIQAKNIMKIEFP